MTWGQRWSLRGKILLLLGVGLGGFLAVGWFVFGLRLPPLQWEPSPRPLMQKSSSGNIFVEAQGAYFVNEANEALVFRAFVPEPTLVVTAKVGSTARVIVQNLSTQLTPGPVPPTSREGLTRHYVFEIEPGMGLLIAPRFPAQRQQFRFAAIGDTGGEKELQRALKRAQELGADFLLHLGDLEYEHGGIRRAADLFNHAKIPTYAAIGNHDFHRGLDLVHRQFAQWIGPRNTSFSLGGVDFLNLDTAADTYPADAGERGTLVDSFLAKEPSPQRFLVLFTHRPWIDPRPGIADDEGHALGSEQERKWLSGAALKVGANLLLHGHIHQSFAFEELGIPAYIVGNGLGLKEVSTSREQPAMLLGTWSKNAPKVVCEWKILVP